MKRGHELHSAEGKVVTTADVHGVNRGALVGAKLGELKRGNDRGLVLFRERHGVAQVIAVPVGEQNPVEAGQFVGSDVGCGVSSEEGIDDDAFVVPLQNETGVPVECRFHSPICFA